MGRGDGSILYDPPGVVKSVRRLNENSEHPGDAFSQKDKETVLFPLVWGAVQEIGDKKERIYLAGNGPSACEKISRALSKENLCIEVEKLYCEWEREALSTGLYHKIVNSGNVANRKDLISIWGDLLCSQITLTRYATINRHAPKLSNEDKDEFLYSLPKPYRLIVSGDNSIKKDYLSGKWRLDSVFIP